MSSAPDPASEPPPGSSPGPPAAEERRLSPGAKLAVEAGPLAVFFFSNAFAKRRLEDAEDSLLWATGAFMVAIVLALLVSLRVERRVPLMTAFTAVFVLIFGGLTLYLQDDYFIKVKSTILNCLFAGLLTAGLAMGRSFLKVVLGDAIQLDDAGWKALTVRWIGFFLFLAAANEIMWRNFSEDAWVSFKFFGVMPLTIVFSLLQLPLMQRHQLEPTPAETPPDAA